MSDKTRLKVALVISDLAVGGGQRMVYELCRHFPDAVDALVLVMNGHSDDLNFEDSFAASGIKTKYFSRVGSRLSLKTVLEIMRDLMLFKPDVVHGHLGGQVIAVLWAKYFHGKSVITMHTTPDKGIKTNLASDVKKLLAKKKLSLVAVSDENLRLTQEAFGVRDGLYVVPNGITLDDYDTDRVFSESTVFVNIARQDANKNQQLLLRAFKKLSEARDNVELILVGDGPEHDKLVNLGSACKGVSVVGSSNEVSHFLSLADVFCMSSKREGLPLAILEAMAAGLPVLSTDVGGISDVVRDGVTGLLVPSDDIDSMFEGMVSMTDAEARKKFSERGKTRVKEFSSEHMAAKYCTIYREVVLNG